jgi:hypothetical protein
MGDSQIFVGHGFKPCRKTWRINSALASGLFGLELPQRLFSRSVFRFRQSYEVAVYQFIIDAIA